jgi:hypothetical protein
MPGVKISIHTMTSAVRLSTMLEYHGCEPEIAHAGWMAVLRIANSSSSIDQAKTVAATAIATLNTALLSGVSPRNAVSAIASGPVT